MTYTFTKADINEAVPLVQRLMTNLATTIADKDLSGSTARTAIGDVMTNAPLLIGSGLIGPRIDTCFDLCRQANATLPQFEDVRRDLAAEAPYTLGAQLIRDYSTQIALAHEGKIISTMTFKSRQDVDALILALQQPFGDAEELAADTMDAMVYRGLVELHAAIVNYLTTTGQRLPMMVDYVFAAPLPTLVISQRLYYDASRYDEIRNENKVVHPAFCPPSGQALSF